MTLTELLASHNIVPRCDSECGDGWVSLVERVILNLSDGCTVSQVKNKFGTLRVCLDNPAGLDLANVNAAEIQSVVTCEKCGARGLLRNLRYLQTLCDGCEAAL